MLSALILLSAPIRGVSVRKMLEQEPPEEKKDDSMAIHHTLEVNEGESFLLQAPTFPFSGQLQSGSWSRRGKEIFRCSFIVMIDSPFLLHCQQSNMSIIQKFNLIMFSRNKLGDFIDWDAPKIVPQPDMSLKFNQTERRDAAVYTFRARFKDGTEMTRDTRLLVRCKFIFPY